MQWPRVDPTGDGYISLLLLSGVLMSDMSVQAYENALRYYQGVKGRNIAIAGANFAANYVYQYRRISMATSGFQVTLRPWRSTEGHHGDVDSTSSIDPTLENGV